MILVDTAIWIDHFTKSSPALIDLLEHDRVLMHSAIVGELAVGSLKNRTEILQLLRQLPRSVPGTDDEVLEFIDRYELHGRGVGFVDVHLLVSTKLTIGSKLWTTDRRLKNIAAEFGAAL